MYNFAYSNADESLSTTAIASAAKAILELIGLEWFFEGGSYSEFYLNKGQI